MKITKKHMQVANLLWEGELTIEEVAKQENMSPSTIYLWKTKPEFDGILKQIDENYRLGAKRKALRLGYKAVNTLDVLMDGRHEKEGETARKAACNILETAEIKEEERESKSSVDVHIIRETIGEEKS